MNLLIIVLLISLIQYACKTEKFDLGEWLRSLNTKRNIIFAIVILLAPLFLKAIGAGLLELFKLTL